MTEAFYSSVMGGSKSSRGGGSSDEEGAGTKKKTKKKGKKVEVEIEEEDEEEDGEEDDKEQGLCSDIFPIYRGTNIFGILLSQPSSAHVSRTFLLSLIVSAVTTLRFFSLPIVFITTVVPTFHHYFSETFLFLSRRV